MVSELQRYVDPAFVYDFKQGPAVVSDEETARQQGLNCISLAYLAIEGLYNCKLEPRLNCYETFTDYKRFPTVGCTQDIAGSLGQMITGDWVWFGGKKSQSVDSFVPQYDADGFLLNWPYSPVSHVAIYTGEKSKEYNDYLLLHATDITGGVDVWPLWRFALNPRYGYGKIRRISRLASH